jgi:hypothetical protein
MSSRWPGGSRGLVLVLHGSGSEGRRDFGDEEEEDEEDEDEDEEVEEDEEEAMAASGGELELEKGAEKRRQAR